MTQKFEEERLRVTQTFLVIKGVSDTDLNAEPGLLITE